MIVMGRAHLGTNFTKVRLLSWTNHTDVGFDVSVLLLHSC